MLICLCCCLQKPVTLTCPWYGFSHISLSLVSWSASHPSACWTTRYTDSKSLYWLLVVRWRSSLHSLLLMEATLFLLQTVNAPMNYIPKQVDYDNHPLYKHGKTGRKQSPVRLFTNISPRDIVLPKEEGYRYHHRAAHSLYTLWRQAVNVNYPREDALPVLQWKITVWHPAVRTCSSWFSLPLF